MKDDFVTKRLYGSGSFDISFFDSAVDRFVRNQGLLASLSGNGNVRNRLLGSVVTGKDSSHPKQPPLLQTARVKRKLKTIVPPEPSGVYLPETGENGIVLTVEPLMEEIGDENSTTDMLSVASKDESLNHTSTTPSKAPVYYTYPTFPEHLNPELFGESRPISSAILAEYDRQREQAGKFRRATVTDEHTDVTTLQNVRRSSTITGQLASVVSLNYWYLLFVQ